MSFELTRYSPSMRQEWNDFVSNARNSTFLFMREYMDYHSDRFNDCSWLIRKGSRLMAVLPANITADGILHSHQGLTYGGWILPPRHIDGADLLGIFENAVERWRAEGIKALDYKTLPFIYSSLPSQEDEYALFRLGARLSESNLSMAIPAGVMNYNKLRKRALAKASLLDFRIFESQDAAPLIHMVDECLRERHNTAPVHTPEEMQLLHDRFPRQIRFWMLEYENTLHAAVCIFDTGRVAHAQYIATTPFAREHNLLTPLFHHLITRVYASRAYFDFGTSNEDHGRLLNAGLLRQKASFGATGVICNRYHLPLHPAPPRS